MSTKVTICLILNRCLNYSLTKIPYFIGRIGKNKLSVVLLAVLLLTAFPLGIFKLAVKYCTVLFLPLKIITNFLVMLLQ